MADYTLGRQNLEKIMLDKEIAPMHHYGEPNKSEKCWLSNDSRLW